MTSQRCLSIKLVCLAAAFACPSPIGAQDGEFLNPVRAIDKASLNGFRARPLFDPSRRLPPSAPARPVEVEVAPPSVDTPPTLRLLGVIHGKRDTAIVQRDGQTKTIILRTGDRIDDWDLTIIPPVGVRLRKGDRTVDYTLFGKIVVGLGAAVTDVDRVPDAAPEALDKSTTR